MLQELPSELISCIATYLPTATAGELAQTCNHCYWSLLPTLYQDLTITKPQALFALSSKLSTNKLYSERASRYVRTISIADHSQRTLARYAATSVLDHVLSGWEQQQIDDEYHKEEQQQQVKQPIYFLATLLDTLFPRLTDFVMDFGLVAQGLEFGYSGDSPIPTSSSSSSSSTDFSGHLKLIHYRPSQPSHLYSLLAPFAKTTRLTLHTRPYLSLCAAIQDSLLMEDDMDALIKLDMRTMTRLELAYVDDLLHVEKFHDMFSTLYSV
ncbi:hypothetical protein BDB00DRAFT_937463 [Zychaea mexicana]|uniref:uncharacterized protein n=1 Tax=Zychaea mexicana TaxID=64656 RepID=UPI0022FE9BCA|nr:uncharacterized protein BDB00DRAFT_937463 [Zychaea mexicana]KAI9495640.1 hypothetical protein BDB00DRAFT_937463 [Zychaea mexicana]